MGIQNVIRWLLPREDRWFEFLEKQAVITDDGARALATIREEAITSQMVREKVQAIEHAGDKLVHELEEQLAATFVTPLDREDLQRLSSEIDAVLDFANATARGFSLLGVDRPTPAMVKLIELLVQCTGKLRDAVPRLRTHDYATLVEEARSVRKLEKEADRVYREELSHLFKDPAVDAKELLREKDLLESLENAVDHCEHVAQSLINLAVKHG